MTMTAIGTPRAIMHVDAVTEACICDKLPGCGGVRYMDMYCPEHGVDATDVHYHTHTMQGNGINRHRRI